MNSESPDMNSPVKPDGIPCRVQKERHEPNAPCAHIRQQHSATPARQLSIIFSAYINEVVRKRANEVTVLSARSNRSRESLENCLAAGVPRLSDALLSQAHAVSYTRPRALLFFNAMRRSLVREKGLT